jgi:hypothetical protein
MATTINIRPSRTTHISQTSGYEEAQLSVSSSGHISFEKSGCGTHYIAGRVG